MRTLPRILTLAAAGVAFAASAQNTNRIVANGTYGELFDTMAADVPLQSGTPGPVDLGLLVGDHFFAQASGSTLTLRSLVANTGSNNQLSSESSFNWYSEVLPGTSGLGVGDPITVTLSFHIDGTVAAGFRAPYEPGPIAFPANYQLNSNVGTSFRLDVYDLDSPTYEGGSPQARVEFQAGASVQSSDIGPSIDYPSGVHYTQQGRYSSLSTQVEGAGAWSWPGGVSDSQTTQTSLIVSETLDVDTLSQSFSIDTFVGNRLQLQGWMSSNLYCLSYTSVGGDGPSCGAQVDFGSTFDGELSANVAGIVFSDITPGVSPVPEPASGLLMFLGMAAVLPRLLGRAG
jgi:hypothetical protein